MPRLLSAARASSSTGPGRRRQPRPSLDGEDLPTLVKRAQKYLQPLTNAPKRKNIVVYDYETKDDGSQRMGWTRPFIVSFYDGKEVRFFQNEESANALPWMRRHLEPDIGLTDIFLRFLFGDFPGATEADRRRYMADSTYIYAHNGGKFDHLFVLGWLRRNRHKYAFEIASVQARIQRLDVWPRGQDKADGHWSFLDSISLLPMSLMKMGETFCKGRFEKFAAWNLNEHESHPFWPWYCGQDAVVAYEGLMAFHDLIEKLGGEVGITAPSTSMNLYRRTFLPKEKWIDRSQHFPECDGICRGPGIDCERRTCDHLCHGCAHAFVRRGYYGGRTEVWGRQSKKDLKYFDITSSYPASMMHPMPAGAMVVPKSNSLFWFKELRRTHIGFVECDVYVPPGCPLPPLPFRHPAGKLVFPSGRANPGPEGIKFTGVWDWDELQLLNHPLVKGKIVKVHKSVWFRQRPIFRNFITTLFGKRAEAKKAKEEGLSETCKLMMNGGYGKFGMNPEKQSILMVAEGGPFPPGAIPLNGCEQEANGDTSIFWTLDHYVDAAYIVPQIAAHVTALSRIRLFEGMADVIGRGGKLFYCDSMTGDRCVPVRDPGGRRHVLPIERLYEWHARFQIGAASRTDGKEQAYLDGWTALAVDKSTGKPAWLPIAAIVRHKSKKPTRRVSTKEGQTEVTIDHGIMARDENGKLEAVTPDRFTADSRAFVRITDPDSASPRKIYALFDEMKRFKIVNKRESSGFALNAAGRITLENMYGNKASIVNEYESGTPTLHALLRVIGAYVSEGSSSIRGQVLPATNPNAKTAVRSMFSIAQDDKSWLEQIQADLTRICDAPTVVMHVIGTAHAIRSGGSFLPATFAVLCGEGHSRNRRLPQFCLDLNAEDFKILWEHLLDGDGHRDRQGETSYISISLELTSQLSFLLGRFGIDHAVNYRPEKKCWTIRTRHAKPRVGRVRLHEEVAADPDAFVYDLCVPAAGTFVDACGGVLLKNTDSILTDILMSPHLMDDDRLGAWKREKPGALLSGHFVRPKLYMLTAHKQGCVDDGCEGCARIWHYPDCKGSSWGCTGCSAQQPRMKGVSSRIATPETFASLLRGEKVHFDRVMQHKTMMKRADGDSVLALKLSYDETGEIVSDTRAFKSVRTPYDKRVLDEKTGDTTPLWLG